MLIEFRRPRKWKFLHRHMVFASSNSTLYDYDRIWKRQKLVQAHGLCSQQLNVMSLYDCLLASLSLWTAQSPGQVSVIDVISVISGKDANQAAEQLRYLVTRYREVQEIFMYFRFLAGQLKTPVTNAHGIVEVIMLLTRERSPGSKSGGRALVQMVVQRLSVSRAFNSARDLLGESENAWDCLGASASV